MPKVITNFEVKDYAHWKRTVDGHAGKREEANIKTIYVGHVLENKNKVHAVLEVPSPDIIQKFMQDPENVKIMKESGRVEGTDKTSMCTD
mgnify:FL=1